MDVKAALLNSVCGDASRERSSLNFLLQSYLTDPGSMILNLSKELFCEETPVNIKKIAADHVCSMFDENVDPNWSEKWRTVSTDHRAQIKANLWMVIYSPKLEPKFHTAASFIIKKIEAFEEKLVESLWSSCQQFELLQHGIIATTKELISACHTLYSDQPGPSNIDKIIGVLYGGISCLNKSHDMRLDLLQAMQKALIHSRAIFVHSNDVSYANSLMRVFFDAIRFPDIRIQETGFDCLGHIFLQFYGMMAAYVNEIFWLTDKAMLDGEDLIAIAATRFWLCVCRKEIVVRNQMDPGSCEYIKKSYEFLAQGLLYTIERNHIDKGGGALNTAKPGGACLASVVQLIGADILGFLDSYINDKMKSQHWWDQVCALNVLCCILKAANSSYPECPFHTYLEVYLNSAFFSFTCRELYAVRNVHLKQYMLRTLRKTIKFSVISNLMGSIVHNNMTMLIETILHCIRNVPHVAGDACRVAHVLAKGYVGSKHSPWSFLLPSSGKTCFQSTVKSILTLIQKEENQESHFLLTTAYKALADLMLCSNDDKAPMIFIIGCSGVGKTSLLSRFYDDSFETSFIASTGFDFKTRTISIEGNNMELQIWDTPGQDRYQPNACFYRGAMGILIVYDITNRASFSNIENLIQNTLKDTSKSVIKILVGNKVDLGESKRAVSTEEGKSLAKELGINFIETSAMSKYDVEIVFYTIAMEIRRKVRTRIVPHR